jgi:hypothetical protein
MTETMSRVTLRIAVACCVLAGCGADNQPAVGSTIAGDSVAGDSVFAPSEERVTLPSSRIYYTLTNHDWYARGESLVHDGRPYDPEGMPVGASLTEMTQAGEFQGVEYYTRAGEAEAAVFVPVFDGYWQRFRADPSARAMPADAGDADSVQDAVGDSVAGAAADTIPERD